MIVSVVSHAASPGVTTLTGLLGWLWPEDLAVERVVLEADVAGGVLAARWHDAHGITLEPGLIDLAASQARAGQGGHVGGATEQPDSVEPSVGEAVQWIRPGFGVVPAPPRGDQTTASLRALSDRGADRLAAAADAVVLADCGRLVPGSAAMGLVTRSAATVVVCRPRLDEIQRLVPLIEELRPRTRALGLVTLGDRPYDPVEVAEHLGVEIYGVMADDPRWAESLRTDGFAAPRLAKSELVRSVGPIASRLAHACAALVRPSGADRETRSRGASSSTS